MFFIFKKKQAKKQEQKNQHYHMKAYTKICSLFWILRKCMPKWVLFLCWNDILLAGNMLSRYTGLVSEQLCSAVM